MPVYATPEPVSVVIELHAAVVRVVASDRADTVVEVRPTDETDESDVKAAQQTRVDHADGTLTVRGKTFVHNFSKKTHSVDLLIEVPTGSRVRGELTSGEVRTTGALNRCRFKASVAHLRFDRTGPLQVSTLGHVSVDAVAGDADISTGSGRVQIGRVDGAAVVKNSNGDTEIGTVAGELRARAANGDVAVDRAGSRVEVKTSNGSVRIGTVVRDSVSLVTASGDIEVGIAAGTAAWLDLKTGYGRVRNELEDVASAPAESEETVEVRAQTSFGDITVRRS
ncbi:DUF4097 family beta strand repeat-containing protein [Pseudonocardia lacus]|uniref:DUF4097 family beta strand repeat-containing protein n=1 Tax=Pseudonocardia lacus TaxID=2835865 RepID=UPI001BDBDF7B|nr:DUF4097 family beta strand repeat-containing protein [Pseudonocardia lacus]